jgi:dihydroflavonol-4-reductase
MTRILVTGANGHLGANTVRSLLRRGYDVTSFMRHNTDRRSLTGLDLAYRYGDVMDRDSLIAAFAGCDVVIHTAAPYTTWAKKADDIIQPAVVGTRNVLAAAQETGIRRLVYTSSIAAVGYARDPNRPRTEQDWHEDARATYFVAKLQAEREALRLSEELGVPTIRLCPAMAYGPYDYRITPSSKLMLMLINDGLMYEGGDSLVDIRDVAEVHAAAVEQGEPGQRYVYGGASLHRRDLAAIITRYTGITPRSLPGGRRVALIVARLLELMAKVTGSPPAFTWGDVYESVDRYGYLDASLAIQTFGIVPRSAEETVRDCIRWLLHLGAIKVTIPDKLLASLPPDPEWLIESGSEPPLPA